MPGRSRVKRHLRWQCATRNSSTGAARVPLSIASHIGPFCHALGAASPTEPPSTMPMVRSPAKPRSPSCAVADADTVAFQTSGVGPGERCDFPSVAMRAPGKATGFARASGCRIKRPSSGSPCSHGGTGSRFACSAEGRALWAFRFTPRHNPTGAAHGVECVDRRGREGVRSRQCVRRRVASCVVIARWFCSEDALSEWPSPP